MPDKQHICIIDDHPVFRKGLAQLINEESDLEVQAEAGSVDEAIRLIDRQPPDLAIVDITLKDRSGLELIEYLSCHHPGLPVLVISMHDESLYAERVLRAGALGYITKQEMTNNVITAVRRVLSGRRYVSDHMMDILLEKMTGGTLTGSDDDPVSALSNRELEVFQLLGRGLKRRQIAERLHLSVKTIGTYQESIKKKLGVKTAGDLMKHAVTFTSNRPA